MHLTPAEYLIHLFGGVRAASRALNKAPSTISKWQNHRGKGGYAGQIPSGAQLQVLEKTRELGLDFTVDNIIYGKSIKKNELNREPK